METVYRDYHSRGVQFFYVYKALAHPENNGFITPFTLEERLQHVAEAKRLLGTQVSCICDAMDNRLKHALGNAPNSEFLFDPEGKLVRRRAWSNPAELRKDLEELVGKVDKPTRVADLDLPRLKPPQTAQRGVVPRVTLPGSMRAIVVKPESSEENQPYFVKLRAEADNQLASTGTGTLYLGFFLDPIHHVHWNNQSEPLHFEIETPAGVTLSPTSGTAPQVKVDADADPREFLITVKQATKATAAEPASLRLKVHYFACDDKQTFCVPVTQQYTISLETDRDGGSRMAKRGRGAGPGGGAERIVTRMMESDKNGDKKISRQEAPKRMREMFDRMDTNQDGLLDREEITAGIQRAMGQRGGGT